MIKSFIFLPFHRRSAAAITAGWALLFWSLFTLGSMQNAAGQQTPTPTSNPIVQTQEIPLENNPDDATMSKEERFRRMREVINKRRQERNQRTAQKNTPTTTTTPKATPAPAAKPGAVATPAAAPGAKPAAAKKKEPGAISEAAIKPQVTVFLTNERASVVVGEQFSTRCSLSNPDHLTMDSFEILISFPQQNMKLVAVHEDQIRPKLATDPKFEADPARGVILYRGRFKEPAKAIEIPVLTLVWKALAPARPAVIEPRVEQFYSSVRNGDQILTQSMIGPKGGVSGASIQILARSSGVPQGDTFITPEFEDEQLTMAGFKPQSSLRRPTLWIAQPQEGQLEPGRWLTIDFGLDNPDGIVFTELSIAAQYDPAAIEVADSDRRNAVRGGINLLDGPFRKVWPWDQHYRNTIDPVRGLIEYDVAMDNLRQQPSGTFARLFVRIKKPVEAPLFTWVWNKGDALDTPATGLYLFGHNLYNAPDGRPQTRVADLMADGEKAPPETYAF